MNFLINTDLVRYKVVRLMSKTRVSKTKLGEILGNYINGDVRKRISHAKPENKNRVYISRANNFLRGEKKTITLQEVNALARFFQKPAGWFLFEKYVELPERVATAPFLLCSPQPETPQMKAGLQQVRSGLKIIGFKRQFIEMRIQAIRTEWRFLKGEQEK